MSYELDSVYDWDDSYHYHEAFDHLPTYNDVDCFINNTFYGFNEEHYKTLIETGEVYVEAPCKKYLDTSLRITLT